MRFLLTIIIWVVIVGGLWSYSRQRGIAEESIVLRTPDIIQVKNQYSLHFTPTFSIEPDPFALQLDDGDNSGVELRVNGLPIPIEPERIKRGVPLTIEQVEGLVVGSNEIYVQASPPLADSSVAHGIRLQLENSGAIALDKTFWNNQGSLVSGTILFNLEATEKEHDH